MRSRSIPLRTRRWNTLESVRVILAPTFLNSNSNQKLFIVQALATKSHHVNRSSESKVIWNRRSTLVRRWLQTELGLVDMEFVGDTMIV